MKEYLLLFRGADRAYLQESPEKYQAHMQEWMQWMGGLQQKGQLSGAQPLAPAAKLVSGPGKAVTDGPFMEGKEMVGGYLLCKAASLDEAVEISKGCPVLKFETGTVEVREIMEM